MKKCKKSKNWFWQNIFITACKSGNGKMFSRSMLRKKSFLADVSDEDLKYAFMDSITSKNMKISKRMLSVLGNRNIDFQFCGDIPILHFSIKAGNFPFVMFLLEVYKISLFRVDECGRDAILFAVENYVDDLEFLLTLTKSAIYFGLKLTEDNETGNTALIEILEGPYDCSEKVQEIVMNIITLSPGCVDEYVMLKAIAKGNKNIVSYLLSTCPYAKDMTIADNLGHVWSMLDLANQMENKEIISLFE